MPSDRKVPKCPNCGGDYLLPGVAGAVAPPRSKPARSWFRSYAVSALACLDCGLVSYWVDEDDRRRLRVFK